MAAVSSNSLPQAQSRPGWRHGGEDYWRRSAAVSSGDGYPEDARGGRVVPGPAMIAGIALFAIFFGAVVAVAELNALYLCISLIGCVFIFLDFRVGVVLLIMLLPISRSAVFPHAMFGVTGLNPFNLLLIGTLASYLLHGLSDGSVRRFIPRPLLWLYILPIIVAGVLGSLHVHEIPLGLFTLGFLEQVSAASYIRDMLVKPLLLVIFALLVGAAVAKSEKPERFLVPTLISILVMSSMVVVYVYMSGAGLDQLARSDERMFLTKALGMHGNELGRLYAVAYALLLFTWAESQDRGFRLALLASMGMVTVALALTFSRGAFLGFVLVSALFVLWRVNARTFAFAGVLAAVALFLVPDAVYDRVTAGFGGGLDAISAGRIDSIWLPLLAEAQHSPIHGNGLSSILWSDLMRTKGGVFVPGVTHPHNAYLEAYFDMGFTGLILLCAYFAHAWKGFRALGVDPALSPAMRGFYLGAAAGLVTFLIIGVTDSSLTPKPEQAFLWLAIGMMYGQRRVGGAADERGR